MCADRGGVFVWPVSNVHVAQHLDASGPARSSHVRRLLPRNREHGATRVVECGVVRYVNNIGGGSGAASTARAVPSL